MVADNNFSERYAVKRVGGEQAAGPLDQGGAPALHVRYFVAHAAIMQYGKDWKKVEQYVKTRSGAQIRSHAQKFFTKLQKLEAGPAPQEPSEQQRRQ